MDNLNNITPEAERFLQEWFDPSTDYIIATTSGTTGRPKSIKLLKADMITSARATCNFFQISSGSVLLCPLSASYIAGKMMIVRSLVSGATLILEEPSSEPIHSSYPPVDLLAVVPAQLPSVLKSTQSIKNIIVGGAPLSPQMEMQLTGCDINVYATYGMTETCSHVALRNVSNGEQVYNGLPGVTFSTDSRNCLQLNLTDFSIKQIITNDIVDLIDEKSFRWLGRADNVIISGGLKIHPEILEQKISQFISVPFFITSVPDPLWGQKIALCLEGEQNAEFETTLLETLKINLPKHELPREILWLNNFKKTDSGKIIRAI